MLTEITNFFLTLLLWSITGGIYHVPIAFFLLTFLCKFWDHQSLLKAIWLSFLLTIMSFGIFFLSIAGILVWWLHVPYILPQDSYVGSYDHLNTCLLLAGFYTGIQLLLVKIMRRWLALHQWRLMLCILCAQILSALLVYKIHFVP